jgi:hypothetical protein
MRVTLVGQGAVRPCGVLGDLGFDLCPQVEAEHLSKTEQEERHIRELFPGTAAPLAPGIETLRDLALQKDRTPAVRP